MKPIQFILLILPFIFLSCQKSEKHTANQGIYDFMKIVIEEQKLDTSYAIDINPRERFNSYDSDSITFDKLLFYIQQKEQEKKEIKLSKDPMDLNDFFSEPMNPLYYLEDFTKDDIAAMKLQKKKLDTFKWDNSRLGFNQSNKKSWYAFSVPLFSKDSTKAVMMIKDLCPGLCGSGQTIVFTKKDNEWSSSMGRFWLH